MGSVFTAVDKRVDPVHTSVTVGQQNNRRGGVRKNTFQEGLSLLC